MPRPAPNLENARHALALLCRAGWTPGRPPSQRELDELLRRAVARLFRLLLPAADDTPAHPTPSAELLQLLRPYQSLDVRGLGDLYEGLLEQRLLFHPPAELRLAQQKAGRKASGSYFTPDAVVDRLCRETLQPKLDACGGAPDKILALRVLDPAMGCGHFLVKTVDVVAAHLLRRRGGDLARWQREVAERCVHGVDRDPMAVELAKAFLLRHCGASGLDRRLKVGDSLLGAPAAMDGGGFDVVLGNPPWDKLKPAKRDFYGSFSEELANTQGASLDTHIAALERDRPELAEDWRRYESAMTKLATELAASGDFPAQKAVVDGRRTGGDPDLAKYFLERSFQLLADGGRLGLVLPASVWQADGATGLRSLVFERKTVDELLVFENYRKWAFDIDSRFKFSTLVASNSPPPAGHRFAAAFMLRGPEPPPGRAVELSLPLIKSFSPGNLALLDLKSPAEAALLAKLHRGLPRLGAPESAWNPKYSCDLHMTHDAWRFKRPEWIEEHGSQALETHRALYEGRMVDNFDHCAKRYVSGEGRKAIWRKLDWEEKRLAPHFYAERSKAFEPSPWRVGYCAVTGATNERTVLACLIPRTCLCGNAVPTLAFDSCAQAVAALTFLNSFVLDALCRSRVSTNLSYNYLRGTPFPPPSALGGKQTLDKALRLSCSTPELATYWDETFPDSPWTWRSAARSPWERAELRAELDAVAAKAYGLDVEDYARILTTFPLLDRNQPPLPGDLFLTEAGNGDFETTPRSFITRDFALLAYFRLKRETPPTDLGRWYQDKVGLDPDGPLSRFRVGELKSLEARVAAARRAGAVAYASKA